MQEFDGKRKLRPPAEIRLTPEEASSAPDSHYDCDPRVVEIDRAVVGTSYLTRRPGDKGPRFVPEGDPEDDWD